MAPSSRPPSRITPKISTMPRQQSESAHYLSIYKLTIEKKRLQQELASLISRQSRIQDRLDVLEREIARQNDRAQMLAQAPDRSPSEPNSVVYPPSHLDQSHQSDPFNTVTLDY